MKGHFKDFTFIIMFLLQSFLIAKAQEIKLERWVSKDIPFVNTFGTFLPNGKLAIVGSKSDFFNLGICVTNTEGKIEKEISISGKKDPISAHQILQSGNELFVFAWQETGIKSSQMRFLKLDTNLNILIDTLIPNHDAFSQISIQNSLVENSERIVVQVSYYDSVGHNYLLRINGSGQIIERQFFNCVSFSSLSKIGGGFSFFAETFKDSLSKLICRKCLIETDNKFSVNRIVSLDTTNLDSSNFKNEFWIQQLFGFNGSPSLIGYNNRDFILSPLQIDTFNGKNHTQNYGMRISQYQGNKLIEEKVLTNERWIHPAYNSSVLTSNESFVVFGVIGVSSSYYPIIPMKSSYLILKFDSNGRQLWEQRISNNDQYFHGTQVISSDDGRLALIGSTYEYTASEISYPYAVILNSDGEVITSIGMDRSLTLSQYSNPYPNPTNSNIHFDLSNEYESRLIIYDSFGRKIMEHTTSGKFQMDISNYNSGIYSYLIATKGLYTKGKFLKVD